MVIPARWWGVTMVALSFAVAFVESGVVLHADAVVPGWDKPVHALCGYGIVLVISPMPHRRRLGVVAAITLGLGWEIVQFFIDPYQGQTPAIYAVDTVTDLAADLLGAVIAQAPPRSRPLLLPEDASATSRHRGVPRRP